MTIPSPKPAVTQIRQDPIPQIMTPNIDIVLSDEVNNVGQEQWFKTYWRPAMAWQYLFVCLYDFFFAPTILNALNFSYKMAFIPWEPLTLKGGGLYHLAMGAILGVAAWSRGQEKTALIENIGPYKMQTNKTQTNQSYRPPIVG